VTGTQCKLCVSKSVTVPGPGGVTYTIDATETTFAQYAAWLATSPSFPPTTPGDVCSGKTSGYRPGADSGDMPVAQVDWCDAYAFCKGVGKRLCGKVGGGTADYYTDWNTTQDQWYNACSSGGVNTYPYGNTYLRDTCNGRDYWVDQNAYTSMCSLPVGTMTSCTSSTPGYTGIVDLSGNVWEWEDSCWTSLGALDECRLRGGARGSNGTDGSMGCAFANSTWERGNANADFGFRCCGE
jgi:formylglycine-generating enzyme